MKQVLPWLKRPGGTSAASSRARLSCGDSALDFAMAAADEQVLLHSRPPGGGSRAQHTRQSRQQHPVLRRRPHRNPHTPLAPRLVAPVPDHNTALVRTPLLRQRLVQPERPRVVGCARLAVQDRNQHKVGVVPADALADPQVGELLKRCLQLLARRKKRPYFVAHPPDRSRFQRCQRKLRSRRRNVVRRFRVA